MTDHKDRAEILARIGKGELDVERGLQLLTSGEQSPEPAPADALPARLEAHVARLVAAEAQIPVETVLPKRALEDFGFDSVMAVNVVRALEADFGKLPPTLLFEHQTVAAIAAYLLEQKETAVRSVLPSEPEKRKEHVAVPNRRRHGEAIAVVGLSARFPEADNVDEFWANLCAGRDSIVEIPADRWDHGVHFDPEPGTPGKSYARWGGFLNAVDRFDADLFNISPREAERMDPQERLFLEQAWLAVEDSGSTKDSRAGKQTGVYVGVMYSQYQLLQAEQALLGNPLHLGSSYATIANRVSYVLDLHGPSFAVDSMCSSSLTALHLAREALVRGEIDLAIAGGVNVSIHPAKFVDLSQGRYAATDGRCRSFGADGDGYVPGEGVAAVVLKRLADAEADGDRIYGVISGSALGHGGKTNGYTVPNPVEQTAVIAAAMAVARVTPAEVSYVEAHGTGTALGDPIEIAALGRAFASREQSAGACAVGSVKSNIGHLESAAGIAGLVKVLLQLRYRELVPSLHAEQLNPNLDLDHNRLTVQRTRTPWEPVAGGRRVAGLSSFGAGGANAHLVVEEHDQPKTASVPAGPHLVVLSARSEDRLRALCSLVAQEAEKHGDDPAWLAGVAHTSQVGRDAWEERLAVVSPDAGSLAGLLGAYARTGSTGSLHRGRVEPGTVTAEADQKAGLDALAAAWVRGAVVAWPVSVPAPAKVHLPSAPLVRERYWPDLVLPNRGASDVVRLAPDHPLVRDHLVHGQPVLPAAALVELARAAGVRAGLGDHLRVEGVTFEAPVVVPEAGRVIRVVVDAGTSRFTVSGDDGTVHSRGRLAASAVRAAERVAVPAVEGLAGEDCYRRFSGRGLRYGPSAQVIDQLALVDGHAFARVRTSLDEVGFRPKLLDGAFHALLAFDADMTVPRVPVAVDSVEMHTTELPDSGWVRATQRGGGSSPVFDLVVVDDSGSTVLSVTGLAVRETSTGDRPVLLRSVWQDVPLRESSSTTGTVVILGEIDGARALAGDVVLCVPGEEFRALGERTYQLDPTDPEHYRALLSEVAGPNAALVDAWQPALPGQVDAFAASLALCKAIATTKAGQVSRVLHVARGDELAPEQLATTALLRTLAAETGTAYRVVHADTGVDLLAVLRAELGTAGERGLVRHDRAGRRQLRVLLEVDAQPADASPYRAGGVYLITGGMGGLGRALALHLARTTSARLVLTGRRSRNEETDAFIAEVVAAGGQAYYAQADIAVLGDAESVVAEAKRRYGALHGIFHLAGVVMDSLLGRKRSDIAAQVLVPKVSGVRNLDAATAGDDLDLFVLFSSAASVLGIAGQADYAYANDYLNHFAEDRRRLRSGRTVAVAWPLWNGGGMDVTPQAKARIADELGWVPLPEETGFALMDGLLAADEPVHAVFYGKRPLILKALQENHIEPATQQQSMSGQAVSPGLRSHLRKIIADELKMPASTLDTGKRFEYLGVESVMVMNVTRKLADVFGDLPTTLFFEYQTVDDLCAHLTAAHPEVVRARFGQPTRQAVAPATTAPVASAPVPSFQLDDPIAVVGLAGRYPMAPTLRDLWANLQEGRDCVTEIPSERWDHSRYFDANGDRPGTSYSRWGGFLEDIDRFDPRFFAIAPREARLMDPQERLFLETAWHAVEDAGYTRDELSRRTVGVFAGVMYSQYQLYGADRTMQEQGFVPSSLSASVANRVSYVLDLRGPSIAVDTMCSSSLTALHLACSAIRAGDCDEAIAGGVNTIPHPNRYLQLSQGRFASTDGRCRSFGVGGDGYVPGEGVGAVLLKRLSRALADGDHVYGLIRGSAVNHGGRSNGYTVPTPVAQAAVIDLALRRSGLSADRIGYVEAHGTGTSLGDPIEIEGLARTFAGVPATVPIGSIKSNIGHLESAAGIAALTKVLLQLKHGLLVPSLHSEVLNPNIDFARVPFAVQREVADWARPGEQARVAAISSFGAGGSNAHLVVEEQLPLPVAADPGQPQVVLLSARTADLLRTTVQQLADELAPTTAVRVVPAEAVATTVAAVLGVGAGDVDPDDDLLSLDLDAVVLNDIAGELSREHHLSLSPQDLIGLRTPRKIAAHIADAGVEHVAVVKPELPLRDVAFTLAVGREPRAERLAVVTGDVEELRKKLEEFVGGGTPDGVVEGHVAEDPGRQLATLLGDAHGAAFIESVRAAGDLDRLAALWVSGVDLRPSRSGQFSDALRLSLPGSPMDRERYWVPESGATAERTVPTQAPAPVEAERTVDRPAVVHAAPSEMDVQAVVVAVMGSVLEIPESEFDPELAHSDLGVDSVLAVEIVDRINQELGSDLKPTDFFSHSTLRKLVRHLTDSAPVMASKPVFEPAVLPVTSAHHRAEPGDIAVIGMSGRFPGARNLDELWANLVGGRDLVREIPRERWDVAEHFDPDGTVAGKTYSKWGSVLEDVDQFDPDFFGISPREARLMDPQQRLYLMEAWRALEDAGYADIALDGLSCHAYVGTSMGDYHHLLKAQGVPIEGYTFTGTHPAVLASRLSYHLNLTGPSLAIDTSCSSSLMAVHLACEAIRSGQTELAIAGGVAALSTPELHVLASKAGMLSPTGRCKPFDDRADGFVPGEGVGVVVLKSLDAALRDGDHVHGVIAASGANQDGRTNGLTAPSAPAQAALQAAVHQRFGIDPAHIGYVECHGTGTKLGDPIEVEALHKSFGGGLAPQSCALGSIKSNLGHTLTAAGVAGLLKVLLCLKHRTLVPTAHVRSLNKYIPFDDGPFHVPTQAQPWTLGHGGPRMAAINSFGFSGTNVHVVVRESAAAAQPADVGDGLWRAFPVSAKTADALRRKLDDLATWLAGHGSAHDVRDIARTLGAGRSHFAVRTVFLARTSAELRDRILRGDSGAGDATGKWADAARDHLAGKSVDWRSLCADDGGRTIPMPVYPFADERYWVPGSALPARGTAPVVVAERVTDTETRTVHIAPSDPIVADHVVDGKPLLPAAGHLSFVHGVLADVLGTAEVTLRRLVWLRPVFVTEPRAVQVVMTGIGGEWVKFEVRSTGSDGEVHQHSRGEARRGAEESSVVQLESVRHRCDRFVEAAEHYARFDRIGILYGAEFATVKGIRLNQNEALAALQQSEERQVVPAGVLDGAIQSVAALHPETEGQRPQVPFAMDEIRLLRPVPQRSNAHIRQSKPGECTITIADESGRACVVIEGMAYRELKNPLSVRLFSPAWQPAPTRPKMAEPKSVLVVVPASDLNLAAAIESRHRGASADVVRVEADGTGALARQIASLHVPERIYFLGGLSRTDGVNSLELLDQAQEAGVRSLLRLVRHLLDRGAGELPLELVVVTADTLAVEAGERMVPHAAGLPGMVRSLAKEQPGWRVGLLDVRSADLATDQVVDAIVAEQGHETGDEIALRSGSRLVRVLHEIQPARAAPPYRSRGVYVILGGAGGIGAVLATHLAATANATVVLLGRRTRDASIDSTLEAVRAAGGQAEYLAVDATDEATMTAALAAVRDRHGPVRGVFHSAIVLRDCLLERMSDADLDAVLEPKVRGSAVLARALRSSLDPDLLDFVVFFSSAQSFTGNAGQANYAAACTFKDAFATRLAQDGVPVRIVNWGYWGEVGVVAKPGYRRRMQAIGVHSISPAEGMAALDAVIAGGALQVMPLKAEDRVLAKFGVVSAPSWPALVLPPGPDGDRLRAAHTELDALGTAHVMRSIQDLGAFRQRGETHVESALAVQLGVVAAHARLWPTLLDMVVAAGFVDREGDTLTATAAVEDLFRRDLGTELSALARDYPEVAAHTELMIACLQEYPALLTGAVQATEVMFPKSSMARVENVYKGDPLADRLNQVAAAAVVARVRQAAGLARIIEIGAGTGGTSSTVLPSLASAGAHVEYVYTDVSVGFLRHGRNRFGGDHPFVRFERLDIEKPVAQQGHEQASFDVVLAANVLHATKDLRTTVEHAASLLRPGGWLVLSETTAFSGFATLTFGLLDGWWRWTDADLRIPGSPLAEARTWQSVLQAAGFRRVAVLPPAVTSTGHIGQNVIVAEFAGTAPVEKESLPVEVSETPPPARHVGGSIRRTLAETISEALGRAQADLDPDRPFTDYGVDSIILVELVNALNERLGIELRTTALFDHPTLNELAAFIEGQSAPATPAAGTPDEIDLLRKLAAGELTVEELHHRLERP